MKYTKKQWAAVDILGSGDISVVSQSPVMISYAAYIDESGAGWVVTYDHRYTQGGRWPTGEFYVSWCGSKGEALQAAKDQASAYECVTAWERDVFGGWHPEGTMERAMAAAKAKVA